MLAGPLGPVLLGALAGVAGTRIGWRLSNRHALPVVQAALGAVAFVASWLVHGATGGALAVGAWALGATIAAVVAFASAPEAIATRVLFAPAYIATMREWVERGGPIERSSVALLRKHVRELAAYLAVALATGNLLAIAMGAVLLNFMNAWFVELLRVADDRRVVVLLGWPCWSIARVLGYVALGAASAAPWAGALGRPADPADIRRLVAAGIALILADVALKVALAPWYARRLGRAVRPTEGR